MKDELKHHENPTDPDDRFHVVFSKFAEKAQEQLNKLSERHAKMQAKIKDTAAFYCVDLKKYPIEELVSDVSVFIENFQVCSHRERDHFAFTQSSMHTLQSSDSSAV